jgi:hypothetical protein
MYLYTPHYFAHVISNIVGISSNEWIIQNSNPKLFLRDLKWTIESEYEMLNIYDSYYFSRHEWELTATEQTILADKHRKKNINYFIDEDCYHSDEIWVIIEWHLSTLERELLNHDLFDSNKLYRCLDLFNVSMETMISNMDSSFKLDESYIRIEGGELKKFAPYLMDTLYSKIHSTNIDKTESKAFQPFKAPFESIYDVVKSKDFPRNNIDAGRFLEWVNLYNCIYEYRDI